MTSIVVAPVRRLLEPADSFESIARDAASVRAFGRAELERVAASLGPEAVALARAEAVALEGASHDRVVDAARQVLGSSAVQRAVASELATVASAAARCRRALIELRGSSPALAEVRRAVFVACFGRSLLVTRRLARVIRDHDVLITGETGTGKEHVAMALLAGALGAPGGDAAPHAALNVAAIPETLVESELFGHRKGAFTGATADRKGVVRMADRGCLFLDEVGELPMQVQVKLLRVIETDRVQPVGSDVLHQVDVRFVAATHRDLPTLVEEGRFRQDLLQRLAGTVIHLPPLRDRPEDVVAIGDAFLDEAASGGSIEAEIVAARRWLRSESARLYDFPGNVRELKNALRNLLLGLPSGLGRLGGAARDPAGIELPAALVEGSMTLAEVERWYLDRAIARAGGNLAAAARVLGVDRTTVARKLRDRVGLAASSAHASSGTVAIGKPRRKSP